jgi:hypothetical protein
MTNKANLLQAIGASDTQRASELVQQMLREGEDPWEIHLAMYPAVQPVLNPPFINPHLPKMYAVNLELAAYLKNEELPALVLLEANEYARRPKMRALPKAGAPKSAVSFEAIESAIRKRDLEETAALMAAFYGQAGVEELARRLLLLGSGYLDNSLGHSVSCTAFILIEMMVRREQDPWPTLSALAYYFCKGGFHSTPRISRESANSGTEAYDRHLLRATSGGGIVNLHHTITRYAIERVRHLLEDEEYHHLLDVWIDFMGDKGAEEIALEIPEQDDDYHGFYGKVTAKNAKAATASLLAMAGSDQGRRRLGRFLVKTICDKYQGDYDPHYLTGLGSALWVVNQYWNQPPIAANALYQYVDYFIGGL